MTARPQKTIPGWEQLRHTGLLFDGSRLHAMAEHVPDALGEHLKRKLRQRAQAAIGGRGDPAGAEETSGFVGFVLEQVCGFDAASGSWQRGSQVPRAQGRRAVTGETVKPRHLWTGPQALRFRSSLTTQAALASAAADEWSARSSVGCARGANTWR